MEYLLNKIKKMIKFEASIKQRDDLYFITVKKEQLELILSYLRDNEGFTHLAFLQAVDYLEDNKFQLTYMLYNYDIKVNLGIKVYIDREKAEMVSIHKFWAHSWQYQRELHEMYGINFPGSPRVEESFVLEGWEEIPPMRRDFNTLEYSIKTYYQRPGRSTNDPAKYMKEKMYKKYAESPKIRRDND
ncbi:MAG: NADH-quinone oxidoreductase subunit C [Candidatus Tenebribacter burtonii]|jgi:NADH-quinone oxidoreductase subunit C|nr:NADH-quinone oxidoreductase subunit C [Candidatus Tenebribacter burtonii]